MAGSQSTNWDAAPAATTAAAVAKNVLAGTSTSRPSTAAEGGIARRRISSALVPELTATACFAPWCAAKRSSSSRPMAPSVSWPVVERLVDAPEDLGAVFRGEVDLRRGHGNRGVGRARSGAGSGHRVSGLYLARAPRLLMLGAAGACGGGCHSYCPPAARRYLIRACVHLRHPSMVDPARPRRSLGACSSSGVGSAWSNRQSPPCDAADGRDYPACDVCATEHPEGPPPGVGTVTDADIRRSLGDTP